MGCSYHYMDNKNSLDKEDIPQIHHQANMCLTDNIRNQTRQTALASRGYKKNTNWNLFQNIVLVDKVHTIHQTNKSLANKMYSCLEWCRNRTHSHIANSNWIHNY